MDLTIDRIEEGIAVLIGKDDGTGRLTVPLPLLPQGSREGDVVTLSFTRNEPATRSAQERITALQDRLKNR